MKTIQTQVIVDQHGQLILPPQANIPPGEYAGVLVLESKSTPAERPPLELPIIDVGPWPEGLSLRREDIYDDGGR